VTLDIELKLSRLKAMTVRELRPRYREVFGEDGRSYHKEFLIRRITWQLQAQE